MGQSIEVSRTGGTHCIPQQEARYSTSLCQNIKTTISLTQPKKIVRPFANYKWADLSSRFEQALTRPGPCCRRKFLTAEPTQLIKNFADRHGKKMPVHAVIYRALATSYRAALSTLPTQTTGPLDDTKYPGVARMNPIKLINHDLDSF
jgi:hypothetical protein